MATKSEPFDCVEMKRKSQEALLREFRSRRDEFGTLADFLNAKLRESERASTIWSKFSSGASAAGLHST